MRLADEVVQRRRAERAAREPRGFPDRVEDDGAVFADQAPVRVLAPTRGRQAVNRGGLGRIRAKGAGDCGRVCEMPMKQHDRARGRDRRMPRPREPTGCPQRAIGERSPFDVGRGGGSADTGAQRGSQALRCSAGSFVALALPMPGKREQAVRLLSAVAPTARVVAGGFPVASVARRARGSRLRGRALRARRVGSRHVGDRPHFPQLGLGPGTAERGGMDRFGHVPARVNSS